METKRCPHCRKTKPVSEFYLNVTSSDGYSAWCGNCNRKAQATRRDHHRRVNAARRLLGL